MIGMHVSCCFRNLSTEMHEMLKTGLHNDPNVHQMSIRFHGRKVQVEEATVWPCHPIVFFNVVF